MMRLRPSVMLVLLAIALVSPSAAEVATPVAASPKRGVSCGPASAAAMGAGWYYTWYIDPGPASVSAEFVPMIAHGKDANGWYWDRIAKLKQQGRVTTLLGFNEPERKAPGGDCSVDDAIRDWPAFEKTGLRLGSPAPAYDKAGRAWLSDFMAKADAKHLRVDFIAVHWYGDVANGAASAGDFMSWLQGMHDQFHKPIWITEFAGLNWGWLHHPITADENQRFISALEPQLARTPWVERYCWFDSKPANLFDDKAHTQPSRVGLAYRGGR
jgi:hypothetical protein